MEDNKREEKEQIKKEKEQRKLEEKKAKLERKQKKIEEKIRRKNLLGEYLTYPSMAVNFIKADKKIKPEKYQFDKNKAQYILYFAPQLKENESPKKQVIVYLYGGGWREGNANLYRFVGRRFAKEKFHTILLGYRLSKKYKYPAQIEDVFAGFNKALEVLKNKNIDYSDIIVIGSSAGAHLGALLVYYKEMHKKYNVDCNIFKGYVSLGGPTDLNVCTNDIITPMLDQLFEEGYNREEANPYNHIDGSEKTKVLCVHSELDPICDVENSIHFSNKVNSFHDGLADCIIFDNKNIYHNNLVNGIFFEAMDSEHILDKVFKWIEKIDN
ncbi:alpha/beta hydrolase [uncultured Brachyspira sp.]|uniref:alpha/beta hydrolase fold domain-containing protein n=1 Tax=uncultured Brachyspira sp. TaxID=221953 RepID=UPI00260EBD97|nr:alpha/beta hydrolase [uncultured Brachyspira sp.]